MHDLFPIRIGMTPVQILTISSLHPFPASSPDSVSLSPPCCQRDIPRTHIWLKHFPADIIPGGFSSSTVPFKMCSRGRGSQSVHDKVSAETESKHLETINIWHRHDIWACDEWTCVTEQGKYRMLPNPRDESQTPSSFWPVTYWGIKTNNCLLP